MEEIPGAGSPVSGEQRRVRFGERTPSAIEQRQIGEKLRAVGGRVTFGESTHSTLEDIASMGSQTTQAEGTQINGQVPSESRVEQPRRVRVTRPPERS
ncbi:MAG: hypothetical protein AAB553_01110 [Patescibacteria group bacterium]